MIKILTIIGARPQIIKAAALSRTVRSKFSGEIEERILHTGQHYDADMSQVFFDELGIPVPDYNLGVGSGPHGRQTAAMIEGIEKVLMGEMPDRSGRCESGWDGVVLYGDTNSTLAGAVAASKLHIPIFHIEAGLRSFNMAMPEEVNRVVCDSLSSILFAPTRTAVENLRMEGLMGKEVRFADGKGRKVVQSGDVMYDNALFFGAMAAERFPRRYDRFVLATVHRDINTDDRRRLTAIFKALTDIAAGNEIDVVIPLHPRTRKLLDVNLEPGVLEKVLKCRKVHLDPPASFLEMLALEQNAEMVITDSGGVQKESFFFGTPAIILRKETEWVEIVENGAGILVDADFNRILAAYDSLTGKSVTFPPFFGDGNAAERICGEILNYLK